MVYTVEEGLNKEITKVCPELVSADLALNSTSKLKSCEFKEDEQNSLS